MTPLNAAHALYSDILDKRAVDREYDYFCGVLDRWTQVYYVKDILAKLLEDETRKERLVRESLRHDTLLRSRNAFIPYDNSVIQQLMDLDAEALSQVLIEGYENPQWDGRSEDRYLLNPLYNLLFTRDAAATLYNRVLINSMSFDVRQRESLIDEVIFRDFFGVETLNAQQWDSWARTEGGDILMASKELMCVGQGARTNPRGLDFLVQTAARERRHFHILVQELPLKPESFIHLDMVFTFLGEHHCMVFEPMLTKQGLFEGKDTTLITIDDGRVSYRQVKNILEGLRLLGWEMEPVLCGGNDPWVQLREQWHSGANFFALGDDKVMGYRRNPYTIEALDHAGFAVIDAEDIIVGKTRMSDYERFVVAFPGAELPRAGGGARCMTMPIWRE